MNKKIILLLLLPICLIQSICAAVDYVTVSTDIDSRYLFRGIPSADKNSALSLNATLTFNNSNFQFSQWFTNSLSNISLYHEAGSMLNYFYPLNETLFASGGAILYLKPSVAETPLLSIEGYVMLSSFNSVLPFYAESYFDFVYKSWYTRITGAYTLDAYLPIQLSASLGANLLAYRRTTLTIPNGLSDFSLKVSTYLAIPRFQLTPMISLHFPLQSAINTQIVTPVFSMNLGYTFNNQGL